MITQSETEASCSSRQQGETTAPPNPSHATHIKRSQLSTQEEKSKLEATNLCSIMGLIISETEKCEAAVKYSQGIHRAWCTETRASSLGQNHCREAIRGLEERLAKLVRAVPHQCFTIAQLYIDKLIARNHTFLLHSLNVTRVTLVSVMVATKFFCDPDQVLPSWVYIQLLNDATTVANLKVLEMRFLAMLDFQLNISQNELDEYKKSLMDLLGTQNQAAEMISTTNADQAQIRDTANQFCDYEASMYTKRQRDQSLESVERCETISIIHQTESSESLEFSLSIDSSIQ
ncbi:hypothetical protein FGO68_gene10083 [Halteria grandinella]|uniref:Cyclin n=1 Tax=Halteria grandinella TaxID=5974 RepID=A0A8J8NLS6_HALGN|nr:hypothetical protein FGO68_gene10083 [Halteria grandinella]